MTGRRGAVRSRDGIRLRRVLVAALALGLVLPGCMNRRDVVPYTPGATPLPGNWSPEALEPFEYERALVPVDNHDLKPDRNHDVKSLSFPSYGRNGQEGNLVTARYYRGRGPGRKPLVVILPIWGSDFEYPVNRMSRVLRSRFEGDANVLKLFGKVRLVDFEAMAAARDVDTFRSITSSMAERCRVTIIDIRRILDWAETQPDVDPNRIALIGFSIGANILAMAALVDERISSAVLVIGSARSAEVIALSDDGRNAEARDVILHRFGWTEERYLEEIKAWFAFLDPVLLSGRGDPGRFLMFDASKDKRMSQSTRDALWEALGRPERVTLHYGHGTAFLSMTILGNGYTTDRIWDFLEERL